MLLNNSISLFLYLVILIFRIGQGERVQAADEKLYSSAKPSSFIYSLSDEQFSDLLLSSYTPSLSPPSDSMKLKLPTYYPMKWDWRDKGVVSSVKNQKKCGGCWAFSVVETLESVLAIKDKTTPPNLSVQQILDCDNTNSGCGGGSTCGALSWLQKNSIGVVPEADYPLTDKSEKCSLVNGTAHSGTVVTKYTCPLPFKNETDILRLLYYHGPLIAGVDANTWNQYMGGIIQYHCGTSINHAIQIVGYDLTGQVPYYIVRNSWGDDWGHNGYVYLRVGSNTCGLTRDINAIIDIERRG